MGNANLTMPPTEAQLQALQVVPMVAALPSIAGATYIVQHVLRSHHRRKRTLTRLLLGMSSMDLIFAMVSAFGVTFRMARRSTASLTEVSRRPYKLPAMLAQQSTGPTPRHCRHTRFSPAQ